MLTSDIQTILNRDLFRWREEINGYQNEADLWELLPGTLNSAGNLTLHIVGNLRHFIGSVLGNSGYIRQRDLEFSQKNISLEDLNNLIDLAVKEVNVALTQLDPARLQDEFPKEVSGQKRDTAFVLLHLQGHLSYHLGQVNYHRRYFNSEN